MVSWSLLCEHGFAWLLLWAWVGLTGCALWSHLRIGTGLASAPLLGVIYWTIALYLLPFFGGLDIAAGAALLLALSALWRRWSESWQMLAWRRFGGATLILGIGCVPYTTTLLYHYLPFGMDGSMHATAAVLIARDHGLPADYAPFTPEVPFPAVNLGLPAVAAIAIHCGGEPAAVMLATHHLTFTCLILATYVLLRWWTAPTSAAVLAVASVWMARASQATLGWGGFPTVLSVAVGVLATRLLLQHARMNSWRLSLATGAAIAAIPLVHGVGGGTWIYCAGIWTVAAALWQSDSRRATLTGLTLAGLWAGGFLLIYRLSGTLNLTPQDMEETRHFVQQNAPAEEGWRAWFAALAYVRKDSGTMIVLAGWAACVLVAWRSSWRAALLLAAAWLSLTTVVANARWYLLPGSFLLYPERTLYWAAPLSAVALALAWRAAPQTWRRSSLAGAGALALLVLAGYFQNQFYQKMVRADFVDQDGWEALVWARQHLQPHKHFVQTEYNTTGSFLPVVAQIGCNGSHYHHFIARQIKQAYARRACTHRFLENAPLKDAEPQGKIVFRNRAVTIVELGEHAEGKMPYLAAQQAPRGASSAAE